MARAHWPFRAVVLAGADLNSCKALLEEPLRAGVHHSPGNWEAAGISLMGAVSLKITSFGSTLRSVSGLRTVGDFS